MGGLPAGPVFQPAPCFELDLSANAGGHPPCVWPRRGDQKLLCVKGWQHNHESW
jgi:hypothetical protein